MCYLFHRVGRDGIGIWIGRMCFSMIHRKPQLMLMFNVVHDGIIGVARVELDFEKGEKMITEVELLFETTLVK